MQLKRVVVTGLGALTPIGNSAEAYWKALAAGESGADTITRFDPTHFKTQFACELKNFDPKDHFDRKEVRRLDPFAQYALVAADEAIEDANLNHSSVDKRRVGVIWASGIGGLITFQDQIIDFTERGKGKEYKFNPFFIPKMILDIASGHISIKHGYMGLNFATVSACASSSNAIIDAYSYLKLGKADAIVVGGSEAAICQAGIGGFNAVQALSKRNDDPKTASRPFDKERDGFVLGEGAGALILETLENAEKRGARIYAEVIGSGLSADAHHITAPHPEGIGAALVMEDCITEAGIKPSEVDYINVHGTSTPLGDVAELKAIQTVFGESAYDLNISSTKSMTGHLLGAAGAIEAIAAVKSIEHGIVPPTINHFTEDEAIDPRLNLTFNEAEIKNVNVALSNTFGFGGHNASILFKKPETSF